MEIYFEDGIWGSVCDTNWGISEAQVVCRQLRYPDTIAAPKDSTFGFGSGIILLDHVSCMGIEDELSHCHHDGWGQHGCDVMNEAGVVCGVSDGSKCTFTISWSTSKDKQELHTKSNIMFHDP